MGKVAGRTDWKDGFLFVGNEPVLDFVNTRPVQDGKPMELLKDFGAGLRWFQAAELLRPGEVTSLERQWESTARAQRTTEALRELREDLRNEILSWEHGGAIHGSTIDHLNSLLADHPMRTKLKANGSAPLAELWFEVREPEDLFAPLAHGAASFVHDGRSQTRPQMCSVRAALPRYQQEGDAPLVQHAAMRKSLESCSVCSSPTQPQLEGSVYAAHLVGSFRRGFDSPLLLHESG